MRLNTALLFVLTLLACQRGADSGSGSVASARDGVSGATRPSAATGDGFPLDLLREANHGRDVIDASGRFVFPASVKRIWIDVGAYWLSKTEPALRQDPDLGLVAVEPLREGWQKWPNNPRLIALPYALDEQEGMMDFHVNQSLDTSSLAKSLNGTWAGEKTRTVEVRTVDVFRLARVLEKIPPELPIEYLKVDVQGRDLQVLKSAGPLIRRIKKVHTEVIITPVYEGSGAERQGTEQEFVEYMQSQGFVMARKFDIYGRAQEDLEFVNQR